jgi:hypothetical protein
MTEAMSLMATISFIIVLSGVRRISLVRAKKSIPTRVAALGNLLAIDLRRRREDVDRFIAVLGS